ncbi:MAG: hypothetical protein EOO69_07195 [Moraxellaceae bacterium]|nr:MAG: hypothetical protein EOO69_07195 [Moraxellaceae bacterium]
MNENEAISIWTGKNYSGCSESDLEEIALRYYLIDGFEALNQNLLGSQLSQNFSPEMKKALFISSDVLSRKLGKLPDYRSEAMVLNLGQHNLFLQPLTSQYLESPISRQYFPEHVIEKIRTTYEIQSPCFISANLGWEVKQQRPHKLIINSMTGKRVDDYSENLDTENEVLFDKNTLFYVEYIEEYKSEIWFYLTEANYVSN